MWSFCQAENWTSCLTTFEIWLAVPCSAETVLPRQTGKWSRSDWDKQRRCVFMAYISARQMVLHAISAPQHYLHLGFIRAILTCVPRDRWHWDFFFIQALEGCRSVPGKKKANYNDGTEVWLPLSGLVFLFFFTGLKMDRVLKTLRF